MQLTTSKTHVKNTHNKFSNKTYPSSSLDEGNIISVNILINNPSTTIATAAQFIKKKKISSQENKIINLVLFQLLTMTKPLTCSHCHRALSGGSRHNAYTISFCKSIINWTGTNKQTIETSHITKKEKKIHSGKSNTINRNF